MAAHYAVSGTTWNGTGTTWAASSGAAPTLADPGAGDDVFLDANSASLAIGAAATCLNFDCTGYTGTLSGSSTLAVSGTTTFKLVAAMTYTYTGTITFNATSGTCALTTAGKTMANAVVFNGVGGKWQHADNWTGASTSSHTMTLTNGHHDVNGKTANCWTYSSSNSNVRVITMGAGTLKAVGTGAITPFDFTTVTNLTLNTNTGTFEISGSTASTRTCNGSINWPSVLISGGSGTMALGPTVALNIDTLTFTSAYTGQWDVYGTTFRGGLSMNAANGTPIGGAVTLTFAATSGTKTIDTAGKAVDVAWTFNGVGGTWQLTSDLTSGATRTCTLTNGTLDLNGKTLLCSIFASNNANTRGLTFGAGVMKAAGTGAITVWNTTDQTGLTMTANTGVLEISGVTASTRTIVNDSSPTVDMPSLKISGGSGAITRTNLNSILDFSNTSSYTGTFANTAMSIRGGVSINSSCAFTAGSAEWTFTATSGTQTLNSGGEALDFPVVFNGAGGTWQLTSNNWNGGTATLRTTTLTAGTLNLNTLWMYTWTFSSNNANTRAMTFGNALLALRGTGAVTVWDTADQTGLTMTANTGDLWIVGVTASTRTIVNDSSPTVDMPGIMLDGGSGAITRTNLNSIYAFESTVGYTGTLANTAMSIRGPITIDSAITLTGGANAWSLVGTSGTHAINSGGEATDFPLTVNGAGGTWRVTTNNWHMDARTLTLTAGTFDLFTASIQVWCNDFSSSNSNTRALVFTGASSPILILAGIGTIWESSTTTGLTVTVGSNLPYISPINGSASARTFNCGSTTVVMPEIIVQGGSGGMTINNANIAGFVSTGVWTGVLANTAVSCRGRFQLDADTGTPTAGANVWTFTSPITVAITSAGKVLDFPMTFDGVGGTWRPADALNVNARALTLTNGTLDAANSNVAITAGNVAASNSNTREIKLGTNTWTLSGSSQAAWNCATATGLTITRAASGTIKLTGTTVTFAGGSKSYRNLWFSAGSTTYTITGSNTFDDLKAAA